MTKYRIGRFSFWLKGSIQGPVPVLTFSDSAGWDWCYVAGPMYRRTCHRCLRVAEQATTEANGGGYS